MRSSAVVTCSDAIMLPAACCALLSISQQNADKKTKYILVGINLTGQEASEIGRFNAANDIEIELVHYEAPADLAMTEGRWSQATLARLFIYLLLPKDLARVLYIDADVLAVASIDALLQENLDDKALGAIDDYIMAFPKKATRREKQLGLRFGPRYFNAGVLLFDWQKCLSEDLLLTARSILSENGGTFRSNDQDVLNIAFQGCWMPLSCRWNVQTGILPFVSSPAILHFTGRRKPWHQSVNWAHRKFAARYECALKSTIWADFTKRRSIIRNAMDFVVFTGNSIGNVRRMAKVRSYFGGDHHRTVAV